MSNSIYLLIAYNNNKNHLKINILTIFGKIPALEHIM
jgi:hypothetical protein